MLLQHAEELTLQRKRELTYLVKEQRAAIGRLYQTLLALGASSCKCARLIAKQFALQQLLRYGSAIYLDKGLVLTQTVLVNDIGDKLLANAGRTSNQYAGVSLGNTLRLLDYLLHDIALVYQMSVARDGLLQYIGVLLKLADTLLEVDSFRDIREQIDNIA